MKIATSLVTAAGSQQPPWQECVDFARAADRIGVDSIWSAEAWIADAVSPLGYLAACTERIRLGAGILQMTARAPAVTAMTAMTLNRISDGRFLLGLGASGPKVVEGLHGIPFERPVSRLRENVQIVRRAISGAPIVHEGDAIRLPHSGRERDAMRLGLPPDPDIPIYLGSLSPKSLELTGELADGWLAQVFVPEGSQAAFASLATGAERSGRSLADLDVVANVPLCFDEDVEGAIERARAALAFTLGAMGSPDKNFYVDAYTRAGYGESARRVQSLWREGKRREATAAVPEELVLRTRLLGDEAQMTARLRAYRDAGVTTLRITPEAASPAARIEALERIVALAS